MCLALPGLTEQQANVCEKLPETVESVPFGTKQVGFLKLKDKKKKRQNDKKKTQRQKDRKAERQKDCGRDIMIVSSSSPYN